MVIGILPWFLVENLTLTVEGYGRLRGRFEIHISVPLILEYEAVASRMLAEIPLSGADVTAVLDYVCAVGLPEEIFYLMCPSISSFLVTETYLERRSAQGTRERFEHALDNVADIDPEPYDALP